MFECLRFLVTWTRVSERQEKSSSRHSLSGTLQLSHRLPPLSSQKLVSRASKWVSPTSGTLIPANTDRGHAHGKKQPRAPALNPDQPSRPMLSHLCHQERLAAFWKLLSPEVSSILYWASSPIHAYLDWAITHLGLRSGQAKANLDPGFTAKLAKYTSLMSNLFFFVFQSVLLQQTWFDPEVRSHDLSAVLSRVRGWHRLQEGTL
jgi:hypothetical protein